MPLGAVFGVASDMAAWTSSLWIVCLFYVIGMWLINVMLTSEFVRKTQLEADQIAARQIQQTLQPEKLEELPGYEVETFYKPFARLAATTSTLSSLRASERFSR